jgi:hypothetical protein
MNQYTLPAVLQGAVMKMTVIWALALTVLVPAAALAQRNAPVEAPFVLEHSYWLQPGETEHFVTLFNRNKLPLLKRELAEGRILWMRISRPRLRSNAASQPDLRLTIAWRNSVVAWDDVDPSRFVQTLFKDDKRWRAEEAERERLIVSRTDVPVQEHSITHE